MYRKHLRNCRLSQKSQLLFWKLQKNLLWLSWWYLPIGTLDGMITPTWMEYPSVSQGSWRLSHWTLLTFKRIWIKMAWKVIYTLWRDYGRNIWAHGDKRFPSSTLTLSIYMKFMQSAKVHLSTFWCQSTQTTAVTILRVWRMPWMLMKRSDCTEYRNRMKKFLDSKHWSSIFGKKPRKKYLVSTIIDFDDSFSNNLWNLSYIS